MGPVAPIEGVTITLEQLRPENLDRPQSAQTKFGPSTRSTGGHPERPLTVRAGRAGRAARW